MLYTNDIYRYIGDSLTYQGYEDIRDVPLEVIQKEIKNYLMMKLYEKDENINLDILFKRLENFIDEKDKPKLMGNFIHYLLWYISMLQSFEVVWYIEFNQKIPTFKESKFYPGKLDGLVTNQDIDYLATFNYCLEIAEKLKEKERGR